MTGVPSQELGCSGQSCAPGRTSDASGVTEQARQAEHDGSGQGAADLRPEVVCDDAAWGQPAQAAAASPGRQQQQHLFDVHVVLHSAYQVPALLLRGYLAGNPHPGWLITADHMKCPASAALPTSLGHRTIPSDVR